MAKNCEEMLNKNNGISGPNKMYFNNDFTKLFVSDNFCTSVYVFTYALNALETT